MYSLKYIGNKHPQKTFKRIIYIGVRTKNPTSLDQLSSNIDCSKTIEEEIITPTYSTSKNLANPLPILVIWENTIGERFYAEAV